MTLEKDKEDKSKYCLSYPKQPVLPALDMKWENRDINVVEWANIPNFNKLDDMVTSLRLLKSLFDGVLVDMIVGYFKLHSHREKADISFEITNEKTHLFLSMLLLSGCHKLPEHKFLADNPDTFV